MERLKHMKEILTEAAHAELSDLEHVCTEELGEVIDMIKDLAEAIYYCTVTEAMGEDKQKHAYSPPRSMDHDHPKTPHEGDVAK